MTERLHVRTTVTLPDLEFDGLEQRGRVYVALGDVTRWLDHAAGAFDKAHANGDIGRAVRACAAAIRETKVS